MKDLPAKEIAHISQRTAKTKAILTQLVRSVPNKTALYFPLLTMIYNWIR